MAQDICTVLHTVTMLILNMTKVFTSESSVRGKKT